MTTKELRIKMEMMEAMLEEVMPRLKFLEAALAVQNKKIKELTNQPQQANLSGNQE